MLETPSSTLPATLTLALKEWAVVQRSLVERHQLVLLRKGGIVEDTGDFDLRARHALVYPTYEHETERLGDIQPCFERWLWEEEERKADRGEVRIESFVEVTDVIELSDRAPLIRLSPQHVWSKQFIDGRFEWEPYKPVFALVVRAYKLAEPRIIPALPQYGGCRSWIELEESFSTEGAVPAVGDEFFGRRRELTVKVLKTPLPQA